MAALVIPSSTTFGGLTNQMITRLLQINSNMERLKDAIATASSGYTGTPGTQFEAASMMQGGAYPGANNFGVQPRVDEAGAAGTDYAYAVDTLAAAWAAFWTAAEASINQLDNGGSF